MRERIYVIRKVVLFLGDLLVFQLALFPTLLIRYGVIRGQDWRLHAIPFGIIGLVWCINFYIADLYLPQTYSEPLKAFRRYLETMVINLALSIAFFYLAPGFGIAPRTNLFIHFLVSLVFAYGWHVFFQRFLLQSSLSDILYIGPESEVFELQALLKNNPYGYRLAGIYHEISAPSERITHRIHTFSSTTELAEAVARHSFQVVVLHEKHVSDTSLRKILHQLMFQAVTFFDRSEIEELIAHRIPVAHISETWLLQHLNEANKDWYEQVKRGMDLLLAIPFGLLTCLLVPCIAIGTAISCPGPLFYTQTRVGKDGRLFELWKFRTMYLDAEKNGPQFTASTKTDTRVTRFGKVLRQLRIDELPQIWNVLKGDLSFVGPRPERPEFVIPLLQQEPFYGLRHLTHPGLTGWAQVTFLKPNASIEDNLTKLEYDLYYVKHRSFVLDAAILLKTIGIVLRRVGV